MLSQSPQSKAEQLMQRIEEHERRMESFSNSSSRNDKLSTSFDPQSANYLDLAAPGRDVATPKKLTRYELDLSRAPKF